MRGATRRAYLVFVSVLAQRRPPCLYRPDNGRDRLLRADPVESRQYFGFEKTDKARENPDVYNLRKEPPHTFWNCADSTGSCCTAHTLMAPDSPCGKRDSLFRQNPLPPPGIHDIHCAHIPDAPANHTNTRGNDIH